VIHQAIAAAYAGRGVAHLTLPQDVLEAKASGAVASLATLKAPPEVPATEADLQAVAACIERADKIVVMCGAGCRGSADLLRDLSDRLKAPLIHTVKGKDLMPFDDPHWMGGIGMIGTKPAYTAVMSCDLLLMLGTDYPYSNFLPPKGTVIQVDERPAVLGRRTPTALGVVGSVRPTLEGLLKIIKPRTDGNFQEEVARQRAKWDEKLNEQADPARDAELIYPQAVARMVGDQARSDAVFVFDTGLNTLWSGNWIRQRGSQRIIGSFNNAAVGTALGQANGVQALDRSRQVIALCGDGGFNMLMCEFLTAVQHKLPVKVVIFNNSAFGLITFEAEGAALAPYKQGIEFSNPDYAALARACGARGFTARRPGELSAAISAAFATEGPVIVDAVVTAKEAPNVPHFDRAMVTHFAIAKVKEAVLAVKGI
jgi:thiamine pyrophosphate-dependent acetolactate synthase large subunit-like protein